MRVISVIELKRCVVDDGIFGVIVSKLCYEKKLCPIILLEVDKGSKVGFYCTILPFGLTIYLWLKSGREFPLDVKKIA